MTNSFRFLKDFVSSITLIFWLGSIDLLHAKDLATQNPGPASDVKESAKKANEEEHETPINSEKGNENQEDEKDFEFEPEDDLGDEPLPKKDQTSNEDSKKLVDLDKEAREAFAQDPYRSLHLSLSPGSEKIQGKGGSSNYGGNSQFLGVDLSLKVNPPDWDQFSLLFSIHFHEFVTTNIVRVRSDANASSAANLRFQRSNFAVTLQKEIFHFEVVHRLYLKLGILASQFPLLETSSFSTGATQLDSFYYTGVAAGGVYEFFWSDRGRMLINALFLLRSFNSLKTIERTSLGLGIKYRLIERLFLETSMRWLKETADYNLHCPDNQQVSCRSKGSLESQLTHVQLGIGIEF